MSWFSLFSRPSAAAIALESETARAAVAMGRIADVLESAANGGERLLPPVETVAAEVLTLPAPSVPATSPDVPLAPASTRRGGKPSRNSREDAA